MRLEPLTVILDKDFKVEKKFYFISGNEDTLIQKIKSSIIEKYKKKEKAVLTTIEFINDFFEEGQFVDGEKHGKWITKYKNGNLSFKGEYINGLPDEKHVFYHINGKVKLAGKYSNGRNFGHLAYSVKNIYETCENLIKNGVTINRPPRDGRMAFIKSPDNISIEILQEGEALPLKEPWISMDNNGSW